MAVIDTQCIVGTTRYSPLLPVHASILNPVDPKDIVNKIYVDSKNTTPYTVWNGAFSFAGTGSALYGVAAAKNVRYTVLQLNAYFIVQIEAIPISLATATSSTMVSTTPIPTLIYPASPVTTTTILINNSAKILGQLEIDSAGYVHYSCPVDDPTHGTWTAGEFAGAFGTSIAF
jgi:hypothetical protein